MTLSAASRNSLRPDAPPGPLARAVFFSTRTPHSPTVQCPPQSSSTLDSRSSIEHAIAFGTSLLSFHRDFVKCSFMGAGPSVKQPNEEASALATLKDIEEGRKCLAGGTHSWVDHEGQHGKGRACARCLTTEDVRCKPHKVLFRIRPQCDIAAPSATQLLELWRKELHRVTAEGGCIAGGEHSWIDVNSTLVRLNGEGRCCEQCGLVESCVTGLERSLGAEPKVLCLPNLVGQFGPAIPKEYRAMYGAEPGSGAPMLQHNMPEGKEAAAGGATGETGAGGLRDSGTS
jgi:hypothetical protein